VLPTLVLAAGLGTRLDPLTRLVAKPAVPLAGRALIERILDHLRLHGIREVVLNLHHRPETITALVGDGAHLGLHVRYSWEPDVLGSAGGPCRALPLLDTDTFLIVNGDTLSDAALAPLLGAHKRSGADVTLAVVPNPAPDRYNGILLDEEHAVLGFVPKGEADHSWHFVGLQIAQSTMFQTLQDGVPTETIAGIYRDRLRHSPGCLHGFPVTTTFHDVGTPRDYLRAALAVAGTSGDASVLEPGATVDATAHVARSVVWASARVGAGAHLEDCVVAGPLTIPRRLRARNSTLVPATLVSEGDSAEIVDDVAVFPFPCP
jgi:NDP-sugar pyrophosphorylase family protein